MSFIDQTIAGLIATIVMTAIILMAPIMKMLPEGYNMITQGLGEMMNRMMGVNPNMAWIVHFVIGTFVHPILYDLIFDSLNFYVYSIIFGVFMVLMVYMGQMQVESEYQMKAAGGIILAHIVYAAVFLAIN